jgi:hypothetical protein
MRDPDFLEIVVEYPLKQIYVYRAAVNIYFCKIWSWWRIWFMINAWQQ